MIVALPPALASAIVVGVAAGIRIEPTALAVAVVSGLSCGAALGPALWSVALYMRNAQGISAGVGLLGFLWVAAARSTTPAWAWFSWTSPAAPAGYLAHPPAPLAAWTWAAVWALAAAISLGVGVVLAKFVREGGDLILDPIH
ncbi:MAG TPA: hypothetical protein VGC92_10105 [Phenylobacterium sp.]